MSNNIQHSEYLSGGLTINPTALKLIVQILGDEQPECGFVTDLLYKDGKDVDPDSLTGDQKIECPTWYGEGSGTSIYTGTWQDALRLCEGDADILVVFENGKMVGFSKRGLAVVQRKVSVTLGDVVVE